MKKILVTGFEPFGGETVNPSYETVKRLPDQIAGVRIIKLKIPTAYYRAVPAIEAAIEEYDPDVVLSIGQAGGRTNITVERVGINIDDSKTPDNEGVCLTDAPICEDGPAAYFVTVPAKVMVEKIIEKGIPASVSNTAGTFVCNHVTYGICHLLETRYPGKKSGFIHIPYLPEQVTGKQGMPSMAQELMTLGITAAIEAIVENG